MPRVLEGDLTAADARIAIIVSRFNDFITERLLSGALSALHRLGIDDERITVAWCPGAFEIPLVARKFAESGAHDAVVCLGAVIRGSTSHFDLVAGGVASGVSEVMHSSGIPVIFGVITTDTIEQAIERAGTKAGNKGADAAVAAMEMISLLRKL